MEDSNNIYNQVMPMPLVAAGGAPFVLESGFGPSRRTLRGRMERLTPAYGKRDAAHNPTEKLTKCLRAGRDKLPPKPAATLQIETTTEALSILKPHFDALMQYYGVNSVEALLPFHARTGSGWQWDHIMPIRFGGDFSIHNVRPRIACHNKARKGDPRPGSIDFQFLSDIPISGPWPINWKSLKGGLL